MNTNPVMAAVDSWRAAVMAAQPKAEQPDIMPEAYYEKGLSLITAERRAYRKACALKTSEASAAWVRASRRLVAHEMAFGGTWNEKGLK